MASIFKKNSKKPVSPEGQLPLPGTEPPPVKKGRGSRPPRERKPRKPLFTRKKSEAAAVQREKKPRKPLFTRKKRSDEAAPSPEAASEAEGAVAAGEPSGQPFGQKKSFFGGKRSAEKKPREKKAPGGGFGSKMSPVGLDLGRSSISAVRLKHSTSGDVMLQAALDQLPEGLIQEGEVRDVDALAFAIRDFWKEHKIRGRKVSIGLANQKIVVRSLDFPILEDKELRSAIEFQAQDYIPIPIEEAVFDYHIMGKFTDEQGIEKQKVLVVAAQKDMVMDFINAIKKAKLSIAGVDLQAFSMLRALVTRSFLDEGMPAQAVAVASIASDVTNLVVDVGGEPQFTRIISFGGDDFTRAVQEQLGNTFAEAEAYKVQIGLPEPSLPEQGGGAAGETGGPEAATQIIPPGAAPVEKTPGEGAPEGPSPEAPATAAPPEDREAPETGGGSPFGAHGLTPGEAPVDEPPSDLWPEDQGETAGQDDDTKQGAVRRALEMAAENLADELRRSLDYYMSQEQSMPVSKLLLSGGGAMMPNLGSYLQQIFPFPVELGDPLKRISENHTGLEDDELNALAPRLAIAIGLALEDEG